MITYPSDILPALLRDNHKFQAVSPQLRTKLSSGRSRSRRLFSAVPTMIPVVLFGTAQQMAWFEDWFETALVSGSDWFLCQLESPLGKTTEQVRFVDIYDGPELVGIDRWKVRATLELFDRPILSGGWALYATSFLTYLTEIDIAFNSNWPSAT